MKRFHVHMRVEDLHASIAFYSRLFATQPSRIEADYAKWMLDNPRINFAISTRGEKPGLDHLGFQADTAQELHELRQHAETADARIDDEGQTTCCYARSEKHWVVDPNGVAWEHFQTLEDIPVFNERSDEATAAACCAPRPAVATMPATKKDATGCCAPGAQASAGTRCCA